MQVIDSELNIFILRHSLEMTLETNKRCVTAEMAECCGESSAPASWTAAALRRFGFELPSRCDPAANSAPPRKPDMVHTDRGVFGQRRLIMDTEPFPF